MLHFESFSTNHFLFPPKMRKWNMEMKKIRISSCLKIVDIRMKWFCVDGRLVCITAAAKIGGKKNWAKKWICASLQWNGSALKITLTSSSFEWGARWRPKRKSEAGELSMPFRGIEVASNFVTSNKTFSFETSSCFIIKMESHRGLNVCQMRFELCCLR